MSAARGEICLCYFGHNFGSDNPCHLEAVIFSTGGIKAMEPLSDHLKPVLINILINSKVLNKWAQHVSNVGQVADTHGLPVIRHSTHESKAE